MPRQRAKTADVNAVDTAKRVAREIVRFEPWANAYGDDLVSHALNQYERIADKESIRNLGGLFATMMRRKLIDIKRHLNVADRKFDELGPDFCEGGTLDQSPSEQVMRREARAKLNLKLRAAITFVTDHEDRMMIEFKVYAFPEPTLQEVGEVVGGLAPGAIHNRLGRYFGFRDRPGALRPVIEIFDELNLDTAKEFVKILENYKEHDVHADPIEAALAYLKQAGKSSPAQRDLAGQAQGRLRWLSNHLPNNRGLMNQVLRRLIMAGCFYVLEEDDAKADHHPRGLRDDVDVLEAIWKAVKNYG